MNEVIVIGGGQSGLAAARAARAHGLTPVILEAGAQPAGSWPHYYDSLTLFSPAGYSGMPGAPFPGDHEHYPTRDEVADYLRRYAAGLDVEIRTGTRVTAVTTDAGGSFLVRTEAGETLPAAAVVAASGSFGNPYLPPLPGQDNFTGQLLHVAGYRNPEPFAGRRVVVVGAGNSAVQVGHELAGIAEVTLATRHPVGFVPQRHDGRDLHYWLRHTGFDDLPPEWLARLVTTTLVLDTGDYRDAVEAGRLDRRPMFTAFDGEGVVWPDGTREPVDAVLFATGYRPHLDYLEPLGALTDGRPRHTGGLSTTHLGLVYVGLEFQRSFASNTLRGVYRDAEYVMRPLTAHVREAGALIA
ncbi:putative flavoprotein involved in K+ transport [Amycolatopsis arida]|uniref:Putative flavoprotein involved in K+ transport n=1 Tax=Amycolatopsis arida TaxID=587909 RepID=A0A1I5PXB0_9PSEU|nr:NAD(P)-binding domain-containing protein [Amycolatopsis arida]TDX98640.1 putative flavoprotein involved in K+ transport [Amycolatopsis arida]SFP38665.1 putative flavoprotein involved in K+ transport [Amycolatopsis arida]